MGEKAKKARKKKLTKAQEEKRKILLDKIIDKWVFVKYHDGIKPQYIYLKHQIKKENSVTKVEQILLGSDEMQDGKYDIKDFDIELKRDAQTNKEIISLKLKEYDQVIGKFADEIVVKNYEELKQTLVGAKYLTEEEFLIYQQSTNKPPNLPEIEMTFSSHEE